MSCLWGGQSWPLESGSAGTIAWLGNILNLSSRGLLRVHLAFWRGTFLALGEHCKQDGCWNSGQ